MLSCQDGLAWYGQIARYQAKIAVGIEGQGRFSIRKKGPLSEPCGVRYVGGMGWKLFQAAIFWAVIVTAIEYKWEADGLAIGVLAGMTAWYATGLANALLGLVLRLVGRSAPRPPRQVVGHLDGWAKEVGLLDKTGQERT